MMHWVSRMALEVVAQSGLGCSMDSLADGSISNSYSVAAKQVMYVPQCSYVSRSPYPIWCRPLMSKMIIVRTYLLSTLVKLGPPRFRRFLVDLLPFENVRRLRDCVDVMYNTSVEILKDKKRAISESNEAVANQIGQGQDIMSVLCMCNYDLCD